MSRALLYTVVSFSSSIRGLPSPAVHNSTAWHSRACTATHLAHKSGCCGGCYNHACSAETLHARRAPHAVGRLYSGHPASSALGSASSCPRLATDPAAPLPLAPIFVSSSPPLSSTSPGWHTMNPAAQLLCAQLLRKFPAAVTVLATSFVQGLLCWIASECLVI